jgi:hypothetical protein
MKSIKACSGLSLPCCTCLLLHARVAGGLARLQQLLDDLRGHLA